MREFESPAKSLGDMNAEVAGRMIAAAADVALVIDAQGVIRDLAFGSEELLREGYYDWLGKAWADTVTIESRPKVEALLRDTKANAAPRWRHINHPSPGGPDLPLSYAAIALPKGSKGNQPIGRSVVFGRDLRANAALQQRLVGAQQAMERDYWRLRHMETRYRSLFQVSSEAVLILDAATGKLEEANPAAHALFGAEALRPGWMLADVFEPARDGRPTSGVGPMFERVRTTGHTETLTARRAGTYVANSATSVNSAPHQRVSSSGESLDRTIHCRSRRQVPRRLRPWHPRRPASPMPSATATPRFPAGA